MAGFFRFNDKEGRGVEKDEPRAPGYIRFFKVFFGWFPKMVAINFIYIFSCLPIITIGPATAGITYIMRNYSQGKHVDLMNDFMKKSKEYFKKGFLIFLIDLIVGILLFLSINLWSDSGLGFTPTVSTVALIVLFFIAYLVICANFYIFPMLVSFDLPLKKLIRNSLILAMYKIGRNIAMLLVNLGIFLLCYIFWPIPLPFMLTIFVSICFLFNNFMVYPVLVKHVAKPSAEDE